VSALAISAPTRSLFVIRRALGEGFQASIRGHILELADPSSNHALAPTPDDLFIVSIASDFAWTAQRFLRAQGLPDDVNVSAEWRTPDDLPRPADISLTVTVPKPAAEMTSALAALFEGTLANQSLGGVVVDVTSEGARP
jgi:hypothetical protein